MRTFRIYDAAHNVVSVQLCDVLKLLAPRSRQASWTVSAIDAGYQWFDATGPGGEMLEALAGKDGPISGHTLTKAAQDTLQVVWGEFSASLPQDPDRIWVIVRAIDSTFYEITTSDGEIIQRVQSTFKDVRPFDSPWRPSSEHA